MTQSPRHDTETTLTAALEMAYRLSDESHDAEFAVVHEGPRRYRAVPWAVTKIGLEVRKWAVVARVRGWRWPSAEWPQVTFDLDDTPHFSPPDLPMETYLEAHAMLCAGCIWCVPLRQRVQLRVIEGGDATGA